MPGIRSPGRRRWVSAAGPAPAGNRDRHGDETTQPVGSSALAVARRVTDSEPESELESVGSWTRIQVVLNMIPTRSPALHQPGARAPAACAAVRPLGRRGRSHRITLGNKLEWASVVRVQSESRSFLGPSLLSLAG